MEVSHLEIKMRENRMTRLDTTRNKLDAKDEVSGRGS